MLDAMDAHQIATAVLSVIVDPCRACGFGDLRKRMQNRTTNGNEYAWLILKEAFQDGSICLLQLHFQTSMGPCVRSNTRSMYSMLRVSAFLTSCTTADRPMAR